ncbi:4a-hydroxytetrahydrobiopterin dehydratase [Candidatus Nanohalobium constans]|uniref:4a-hydroxytetrahydrobiopterin dehydratase n=1 Tax=Candidatus Nanohalobium constans TaxID=2565781 RepID=A0A5Q0UH88_9ARCH|nr:4a-hydroxytetrahydrobiopterin dehydratase [Candidatus Nanohalobium constans]QGA80580.1 4a-hydroxytetrahydrobiopterin dehydratase [Candidatus Nanohalobium constans]
MANLSGQVCTACSGDAEKLKATEALQKMDELHDDWELEDNHHIKREFEFEDFQEALDFVNKVGEIAEEQGHHPVINDFTWGKATVKLYTHKIDGLHENDFIMAAKIDEVY